MQKTSMSQTERIAVPQHYEFKPFVCTPHVVAMETSIGFVGTSHLELVVVVIRSVREQF